jgi:hypothetical protein
LPEASRKSLKSLKSYLITLHAMLQHVTTSMVISFIFYYPHPNSPNESFATTDPYPGMLIDQLWGLAWEKQPSLADHIGRAKCMFFIICSFFLYTTGSFSYIHFSCPTCLSFHTTPCSLAAEIGFGSTVMMAKWPPSFITSPMSSLVMCTGYPQVILRIPVPLPMKTHTHSPGYGFLVGL